MTSAPSNTADATHATALRAELKDWERTFASAHGGRKAERSDIKKHPDIAAKYKEYNRLKSLESTSTKDKHTSQNNSTDIAKPDKDSKKRKHASSTGPENAEPAPTPRKTAKHTFATPSTNRITGSHPSQLDPYDSPTALRRLFSPSTHRTPLKAAIGPTPQRDGKTLGLFDLLSESGGSTATPSANRTADMRGDAVQTPSKRKTMDTITEEADEDEETLKPERTPASSGKRFMLSNLFATPTTLRYAAMADGEDNTKTAINANQPEAGQSVQEAVDSGTPAFLRRSNSGRYANGASDGFSPTAVRKPQRFVGKGLSALVQGLRDMEEERLQDDTDVLREIEADAEAGASGDVDVGDSQAQENDTGPVRKKKGQKRTTRRVTMRPVVVQKPTRESQRDAGDESDNDENTAVPETQHPDVSGDGEQPDIDDAASLHTMSEPDAGSDPDYGEESNNGTKSKSFSERIREAVSSVAKPQSKPRRQKESQPTSKKEEKKPRARKVNPDAHANYRALKIGKKGATGRFAGRFRRR